MSDRETRRLKAVADTAELAEVLKINPEPARTDGHLITKPGIYELPHEVYHADPTPNGSLSCSGARLLLPPNCPALFRWMQDHPNARSTRTMDLGAVAHAKLLGIGPDLIEIKAPDYKSQAAQRARDEAHSCGGIPVLTRELEQIDEMIKALMEHPKIKKIFTSPGAPEQSIFWQDQQTGITRRCRVDWLPERGPLVDYKTARSAHPREFARAVVNFGYDMAAQWYSEGHSAVTGGDLRGFLFIVQERQPPYLPSAVHLDEVAYERGAKLNRRAIELYVQCTRSGVWPGYTDVAPELISLPAWAEREAEEM